MISARQQAANERNAHKSTGPATATGRERSAKNATTHGLTTSGALLDSEDAEAYARHMQSYRANHMPQNEQEEFLVTQLGESSWRLRRVRKFETGILNTDPTLASEDTLNKVCKLSRYEAAIERSYYRAFRELEKLFEMHTRAKIAADDAYILGPLPYTPYYAQPAATSDQPEKTPEMKPQTAPETPATNRTHSQNRTPEFPGAAALLGLHTLHLEDEETQAGINRMAELAWKVQTGARK
jgi:hypothetical protein